MESFLSGIDTTIPVGAPRARSAEGPTRNFAEVLASAAVAGGHPAARVACLLQLRAQRDSLLFAQTLNALAGSDVPTHARASLAVEAAWLSGDHARAYELWAADANDDTATECDAYRMRQLARVTRSLGRPSLAISRLTNWLARFPDSADSGPVWLDLGVNAARAGAQFHEVAAHALARARTLLGDLPVLDKADRLLAAVPLDNTLERALA
jgi:hypothetical protein